MRDVENDAGAGNAGRACLFLLDSLGIGGSERKTIAVANRLARRGRNIHLAFLNLRYDLRDTLEPSIQTLNLQRSGKLDLRAVRRLREYLDANQIGTIWSVNLYPMLYAFVAVRRKSSGVRVIGSANVSVFRNLYENLKMLIYTPIIRWVDVFVFGSERQMNEWKTQYFIGQEAFVVVHNGVDLSRFSPEEKLRQRDAQRRQFGISDREIVIGKVAQFRIEKAYPDLLKACKALIDEGQPIKLLLVGDGPTIDEAKSLARSLGMDSAVIFAGLMEDVRPALYAMDIFALTSVAVETFSNAVLEAMAAGLPVVLSDVGGAREMVDPGVNGYLYPPGDTKELAKQLSLATDPDTRARMGRAAREIVETRFSAERMADRYETLIWSDQ